MFEDKSPEVLISGAGPVGLFAALSLARRGIRVKIIDSGVWPCTHSYALALHPQSLALFAELGLRDAVLSRACPVRRIELCDAGGKRAALELEGLVEGPSCLAVVGQEVLESLLNRALREQGVKVEWQHELSGLKLGEHGVEASVDTLEKESRGYSVAHTEWIVSKSSTFEVPFVIGADGHSSRVRRELKIAFDETGPHAYYAVFEFRTDADPGEAMRIVLNQETTDVLWPLPSGHCRWGFELPGFSPGEASRWKDRSLVSHPNLPVLQEGSLKALLEQRAPWFRGSIEHFTWRTVVCFERRLAAAFGAGRCWLAGDAAHLAGPVGTQSMNLGFFEVRDLAETLTRVLREGGDLATLAEYDSRWLRIWRKLSGGAIEPEAGADEWIASHARGLLGCLPAHGTALTALGGRLGLRC